MADNMTDSKVLDRIIDRADHEEFWSDSVMFKELRLAIEEGEKHRVYVNEGTTDRWADVRALNVSTLMLWDPKWTFSTLRTEAPNNAEDLLDSMDQALVNATKTQVVEDEFDVARTRGFIRKICQLAQTLAQDNREDNYTYRVFRVLAQSETKLNMGTNPLGDTKEFYGRHGPIRIDTEKEQEMEERREQTKSAAEADW